MTKKEAKNIADLCINVTPAVEDAFIFLNSVENDRTLTDIQAMSDEEYDAYYAYKAQAQRAGDRMLALTVVKRNDAINKAFRMIDNIQKYGFACVSWMPD